MSELPLKPAPINALARWIEAPYLRFAPSRIKAEGLSPRSQKSPKERVSIERRWQNRSTPWNLSVISCDNSVKGKERANSTPQCMKSLELRFCRLRFLLVGSRPERLPLSSSITQVVAQDDSNYIQDLDSFNKRRARFQRGAPLARYSSEGF